MSRKSVSSARVNETEVLLDLGGSFSVTLPFQRENGDSFLVIDIYDLDNPVHPEGHIGWWRFGIEQLPEKVNGNLAQRHNGMISLSIDGGIPVDEWRNPAPPNAHRLELLVVMRSAITNAILSIDRVPVLRSRRDLGNFRLQCERAFERTRYVSHSADLRLGGRVHIVSKAIFEKDAVGNLCLALYGLLRQHGVEARLYADEFNLAMNDIVHRRAALASEVGINDVIFFCFSTYDQGLEGILELECHRRIAYYHGITSPRLLQVFDIEMSAQCAKAIRQLPLLGRFDQMAVNSEANAANLRETVATSGASPTKAIEIIPPKILSKQELRLPISDAKLGPLRPNLLYVGRIASHKRIEDLLELVAQYRLLDPLVSCKIVGSSATPAYSDYLNWVQTRQLNLPEGIVSWLGELSESELVRAYEEATVYVSMSEDEGFCLPILEAMMRDSLVLAYDLPAIRELMGASGVIFSDKSHWDLARRIHELLRSPSTCREILKAQRERAREVMQAMDGGGFVSLLADHFCT